MFKVKPKPNSLIWEGRLGSPTQRHLCAHKQQVRSRLDIQVGIFMGLMHTCHIVTINTSIPLFFPVLLPFDQVK